MDLTIIKEFLFGKRTETTYEFKPGITTKHYGGFSTYADWCKEFRVSMMHGKKAVEFPYIPQSLSNEIKN